MEYYQNPLFHNIDQNEFHLMRHCLNAREQFFEAGETICTYGVSFQSVGILSSGSASTIRFELNGSRTILEHLKEQNLFGELLAYQNFRYEGICVICNTPCQVLFIDYSHILSPCAKVCPCHQQLIQNMLSLVSMKAFLLSERVEILSKRTIREKLLAYFYQLAHKSGSLQFVLPFSQSDLADYLSIDRSAMGRELKKLREEGILTMKRREIILTDAANQTEAKPSLAQ